MDIKRTIGSIHLPNQVKPASPTEKPLQMGSTTDRDANGQMAQGGNQEHHPPMTDEQLQEALEHIKNIQGIKDNNLTVFLLKENDKNFIIVKDPDGKVVRRIPEQELWTLSKFKDSPKAQIFNKVA